MKLLSGTQFHGQPFFRRLPARRRPDCFPGPRYLTHWQPFYNRMRNLWGVDLYAPTFFTDPETKIIYADRADNEGMLEPSGQIWTGQFPEQMNPANSTAQLGGMRWVMALWPLPEEAFDRNILLVHETFHYRQPELQLDPNPGICSHMETLPARIWLKTEWNALDAPFPPKTPHRTDALLDALRIREPVTCIPPKPWSTKTPSSSRGFPNIRLRGTAHMKNKSSKSRIRHLGQRIIRIPAYHSGRPMVTCLTAIMFHGGTA